MATTEAGAGRITDEAVARLRSRIGVAEPHPQPPHYRELTADVFRHVAEAYGDDNPLWCDPGYGAATRWQGPIAPPPLVGGDTLVGEDEVTTVAPEARELMKGDPLRGVHAFYGASAREWWAPLRPGARVTRRNALVGVLDKPSEFAGRAVHEWTGQVFRQAGGPAAVGPVPARDPHRAGQGPPGPQVRRGRAGALHGRADRRDRGAVRRRGPAGPSPAGGRTSPSATRSGPW